MTNELSKLSAMVVDDEEIIVDITSELLRSLGIGEITAAMDGKTALRMLDAMREFPNLILCDLNMPSMDGIQFIRHLGERQVRSGIILVSGEDSRILHSVEAMARSYDLYVLGVIEKPINLAPMLVLLNSYSDAGKTAKLVAAQPISDEELRAGIESDYVVLVYQPKADIVNGKIRGVEVLARWAHPTRGLLGPATFVPLAEETGRINELTDLIFRKALAQCAEWRAGGLDLSISVNFSVGNLHWLDLPEHILACAAKAGIPPAKIVIELTESHVMNDLKASLEILGRLRLKGVQLSIDDFGTGYSSMEQLKRTPFTELKVDRAFVFEAANDPAARAILDSSAALGRRLNMTVVAEGAETESDVELALAAGCDLIQGYHVAKPMLGNAVAAWVKEWELRQPRIT